MALRIYRTRPWLWLAMSIFAFIALGLVDWRNPKEGEGDLSFGVSLLDSLREVSFGHEPAQRIWVLVPWLLVWPVISGVVGWCLHSAVVVLSSRLEKGGPSAGYLIALGALGVFLLSWLFTTERYSASRNYSSPTGRRRHLANMLIEKLPSQYQMQAFRMYSEIVEGEWFIPVPYNPMKGPWFDLEKAMFGFANSNGMHILGYWSAGSTNAYVLVRHKDLAAMSRFVRSMGQSATKAGAANPSSPPGSETNRTSAAAGGGR